METPLGYYEYLPPGYDDGSSPLLVFLHGFDFSGTDDLENLLLTGIPQLIANDEWPSERPFVVLAPQHLYPQEFAHYAPCDGVEHGGSCSMRIQHELGHPDNGSICHTPAEVHDFLSYAIASYDVDPERVYLTGLSCGATGAWEYVGEYGGSQIAAMVPIAGEGRPAWEAAMCGLGEVAIWAFHGDADDLVAPAGSIATITNLTACPRPLSDVELTVYPGVDHDSWTATYDQSAGHDIYDWLLGYTVTRLADAESTGATFPEDAIADPTVSATPEPAAETSVAMTPDTIG
jgi:predicted peptidase